MRRATSPRHARPPRRAPSPGASTSTSRPANSTTATSDSWSETHLARIRPELPDDLRALSETGVRLAADDYGTGYSPLTKITELPLDMVKIDKQFVAKMLTDPRSMAVVEALVGLGMALALDVVAEGVETREQAEALRRAGCHLAQGFLWSRAIPPDQFLDLLTWRQPNLGVLPGLHRSEEHPAITQELEGGLGRV